MPFAKAMEVSFEVDLRHDRGRALQVLDKYLDDALLAGLSQVRIIQGRAPAPFARPSKTCGRTEDRGVAPG